MAAGGAREKPLRARNKSRGRGGRLSQTKFHVSLDDKFDLTKSFVFLNGVQAVLRMLLMQKERDRRAGLNTAGFISGYRGSPLGGFDLQLTRSGKCWREQHRIQARPQRGTRRDRWSGARSRRRCAARAAMTASSRSGTARGRASTARGDALRHANLAGTSRHGRRSRADGRRSHGQILDHGASERIPFRRRDDPDPQSGGRAGNPRLRALRLGHEPLRRQLGRAQAGQGQHRIDGLGRTARSSRVQIIAPADFAMPPGGLNIRPNDAILGQEERLQELQARRHDRLHRARTAQPGHHLRRRRTPSIGIITTGKSYLDVRQAFDDLGIDEVRANDLGIRVYKVGMPWPLEQGEFGQFARRSRHDHRGRGEALAHRGAGSRRALRHGQSAALRRQEGRARRMAFPGRRARSTRTTSQSPSANGCLRYRRSEEVEAKVARARSRRRRCSPSAGCRRAPPYFCSGCPHNTSTKVPEGSRALAGIGCHYMAIWMDRGTEPSPRWAARARIGSARRRSRARRTSSRISATAPTTIRGVLAIRAGGRGQGQHHLQDSLQRCRRHDRRPDASKAG